MISLTHITNNLQLVASLLATPHPRTGSFDKYLRIKDHVHTFVNEGGELGALDFRFPIGAPVSGLQVRGQEERSDDCLSPTFFGLSSLVP